MKRLSILLVMVFSTLMTCYATTGELKTTTFQPVQLCTISASVYEQVVVVCEGGNVLTATAVGNCTRTAISCELALSDAKNCAYGVLIGNVNLLTAQLLASCIP